MVARWRGTRTPGRAGGSAAAFAAAAAATRHAGGGGGAPVESKSFLWLFRGVELEDLAGKSLPSVVHRC